jgi:hypothetical protein
MIVGKLKTVQILLMGLSNVSRTISSGVIGSMRGTMKMTERDLTKELLYTNYIDMDNGDDVESIDYRSLIHIITELMSRVEKLEAKVS